jgi:hypothetical protein|tara:strand:- start:99 stop:455 length:357 start_codon:yes stop_codon:yes gene_type:complete
MPTVSCKKTESNHLHMEIRGADRFGILSFKNSPLEVTIEDEKAIIKTGGLLRQLVNIFGAGKMGEFVTDPHLSIEAYGPELAYRVVYGLRAIYGAENVRLMPDDEVFNSYVMKYTKGK